MEPSSPSQLVDKMSVYFVSAEVETALEEVLVSQINPDLVFVLMLLMKCFLLQYKQV